jgi:hypothetical protein
MAGGEFEEECVDVAVHVVGWVVGQARHEAANDEGDQQMLVVHVVEGEHGAAGEEELAGERLEAERIERDTQGLVGFIGRGGGERSYSQEQKEAGEKARTEDRDGTPGNRHGGTRVSIVRRVALLCHRQRILAKGWGEVFWPGAICVSDNTNAEAAG